jgi:hypothetical protein
MNEWFSPTCDRLSHPVTVETVSTATNRLFEAPRTEQIELAPPIAPSAENASDQPTSRDPLTRIAEQGSPIRRILIPMDANHTVPADLKPILKFARQCDAEVTLLHCYSTPPSFDYAVGPSAQMDISLHRNTVRARLPKLCDDVQKFFPQCC